LTIVLVAAACGTGGKVGAGDPAHGKQVFTQTCGSCHTLAAAGTSGTIGPNLDNAFSADRSQGFKSSTIEQVVADQIRVPLQGVDCPKITYQPKSGTTKCAPARTNSSAAKAESLASPRCQAPPWTKT